MRRFFALVLVIVTAISFTACKDSKNMNNDTSLSGEITFWHSFTQGSRMEAIDDAVMKFEEIYPNVKINTESMTWADFKDKWKSGKETGDLPDISTACNMYEVEELVNSGLLQPVDEIINDIGKDLFSDNVLSELSYENGIYGIPYYSHSFVMWYRQDLLDSAGIDVPETWDELYEAAKLLTDPANNIYGCPVSMGSNDFVATIMLHMYVCSGGGSLLNDDLTANLTSDLAIDGIKYWVKMYKDCSPAESIDYTIYDQATLFYEGKTAFDFNSGFHISGVAGSREDLLDSISCTVLPKINEKDEYYSAEVTHIPLVTYKNAKNTEICKAFIKFLFEEENYIKFLDSVPVGMLPSIRGISSTEDYQSNETRIKFADEEKIISEAMLNGYALGFEHGPNLQSGILTSSGVIEKMFQDIIKNETDVETAAQNAENELNRLFKEAQNKEE